jgi:16S rRNA processing protein RimM
MTTVSSEPYSFKVGTIVGIKGLNGEVKLRLDSDFDLIENIQSVKLALIKAEAVDAEVSSIKMQGKSVLMRLKGFNTRNDIETLIGADIFTQKGQLRELDENEWWFGDLVGLTAYTTGGARVGVVSAVVESGNYLLEIEAGDKTFLVPFVKELVPTVDIAGKRLEIEPLPGLLD